mmetsp:Transcript_127496/g.190020  ORF Transcript_127496/g.190020 Transcript_127496/m.190020 type:complete len:129 (+) Transcript_127496:1412-1798(+)
MYESKISFSIIYIREAHAQDAWPISSSRFTPNKEPVIVNTPKSTNERVKIVSQFLEMFSLHESIRVLVDSLDHGDSFLKRFTPWPIQVFLLRADDEFQFSLQSIFHAKDSTLPLDEILSTTADVFNSA